MTDILDRLAPHIQGHFNDAAEVRVALLCDAHAVIETLRRDLDQAHKERKGAEERIEHLSEQLDMERCAVEELTSIANVLRDELHSLTGKGVLVTGVTRIGPEILLIVSDHDEDRALPLAEALERMGATREEIARALGGSRG